MRPRADWFDLDDASIVEPDIAIVGLPFDGSVSLRAGAAEAPARIRQVSRTSDAVTRDGRRLSRGVVRDYGDVPLDPADTQEAYFGRVREVLAALPPTALPLVLGGDNSVSIPAFQQFVAARGTDVGIVWFDAHPDLIALYDGNPASHACALHRAMSLTNVPFDHAVLVGTRSYALEESILIERKQIPVITAGAFHEHGWRRAAERTVEAVRRFSAVYLAVDIDGFDASAAPGTGYPMPAGISAADGLAWLSVVASELPVRAMDITEVAPPLDVNDMTSFLAAQIVLEILGLRRA